MVEITENKVKELQEMARRMRLNGLEMALSTGSHGSHLGGSFSCIEIMAVLYGEILRFDKDNPQVHNSTQVLEKMKKKEEILYAINRGQNEEIGVLTPIPDSSSVGVALMPDHGIDWIMFPA